MWLDYVSEVRNSTKCHVSCVPNDESSVILFLMKSEDPSKPVCRSYVAFKNPVDASIVKKGEGEII